MTRRQREQWITALRTQVHNFQTMNISIGHGLTYLECPCCGDNGAASDGEGCFVDGQSLICGCPGWVSVDSDGDDDPYINNGDAECLKCRAND